jgi:hypothetical protein
MDWGRTVAVRPGPSYNCIYMYQTNPMIPYDSILFLILYHSIPYDSILYDTIRYSDPVALENLST